MTPFALSLARPIRDVITPDGLISYSHDQQLNLLSNGKPFVNDPIATTFGTGTSSTAGSKTHQDDTD